MNGAGDKREWHFQYSRSAVTLSEDGDYLRCVHSRAHARSRP